MSDLPPSHSPLSVDDSPTHTPLLTSHRLEEDSAFTPQDLLQAVRGLRGLKQQPVPPVCILEFDGDLSDALVADGVIKPIDHWACFHTVMYVGEFEGAAWGIIPRTIGGPYAVLIAEQLHAAGAKLVVGLSSAGRVSPKLSLPSLVVASSAVRDEGTSLHYLPASRAVACPFQGNHLIAEELSSIGWHVEVGEVWTTDAPYRETMTQLKHWSAENVLAVEMQAASLFAFGTAKQAEVALVAVVSNAVDHTEANFDTGTPTDGLRIVQAIIRAAQRYRNGN